MRRLSVGVSLLWLVLGAADLHAQTGIARGRVVDEDGRPVADADVRFIFQGPVTRPPYEAKTDAKGQYTLIVAHGRYHVEATKADYRGVRIDHVVDAGEAPRLPDIAITSREAAMQEVLDPIQRLFDQAMTATRESRLDDAESAYTELIAIDPSIVELHYNLGTVYLKRGDAAAAEQSLLRALEVRPDHRPATLALAQVYEKAGRQQDAIALMERAAETHPDDEEIQFRLGVLYLNEGRTGDAEPLFARVAELDPGNADARYLLGTIALNGGDVDAALAHLEEYLSLASAEDAERAATVRRTVDALKKSQPQP